MNVNGFDDLADLLLETSFHLTFDKIPQLIPLKEVFLDRDYSRSKPY